MTRFICAALAVSVLFATSVAEAQEQFPAPTQPAATQQGGTRGATAHPFTKHPVSQEELARAILAGKDGDMSVLYLPASKYVEAMNAAFPYLRLENRVALAEHIRTVEVRPCPQGRTRLLRVLDGGRVDLKGWTRDIRNGELCGYNASENRYEMSFFCGNPTPELFGKKVATAPAPPFVNPVIQTVHDTVRVETNTVETKIVKEGWRCGGWCKAGIVTALAAGTAAAIAASSRVKATSSSSSCSGGVCTSSMVQPSRGLQFSLPIFSPSRP